MEQNVFFLPHEGLKLAELAEFLGAELANSDHADVIVRSVAPIHRARAGDVCYILSRRNRDELATCEASAVICDKALVDLVPPHIPVILSSNPHAAFAMAGGLFYPAALRPVVFSSVESEIAPSAVIGPSAKLEKGVIVEPMAVIGAHAEIGEGTRIGAHSIIGPNVKIGRDCSIAAGASVLCALVGNGVIIHNGARIGQDGFGYAPGPRGMIKIVQIGRVIIQDNVEIGANTTIDRGAMDDTVIGEGTKIDNQVQIGHNVQIGRHCAIVAQVGIAGSAKIGNGVQIGGQVGIKGHVTIGDGVQIAAKSGIMTDLAAGGQYGGIPARPLKDYLREAAQQVSKSKLRGRNPGGKEND
ncbi:MULTISPECIES: UDP-3-O-(3-hydroxymyristoyl)glucosamine N-acyltransferase [unclassified Rhizobium]|uniref:UDP-3-O-(3-hydroxymyristoyl)glucosamine N-acyltransferase n=1 Tax=unclassified Rhizobium TaxID=2613769 RepID=UPI001A99E503|nr:MULTISPECIES: UDP-3-O-(3-hydroxymyristoyl)glucosamine N-acyltransferase [unclassified Rhizobium]MBX5158998.1 UDP-3-O-(3-hydroxymyristoyl)glucosamine N-acyltransferase [Rhizobium sp. NZLR8]MBX5173284.1 UDP-3-O-(3-hydroxymyristoyl)glucosamine N-acyltransferase [Rhizobium sp. NZLR1b]MBX5182439.1 UDP-3-O-(3-hydroxymyristoyl)glucosamine N-acyltransferase [Rhizobium sp. NZLR5]MBX5189292.1 UDP-3-O-(3-hydroxymyristoyl)glucosamine N-acyltransferase [Rhizobium sp. NZLR3b]MBX5194551.1 UDP-3-O-(3-hydro